jgi:hypothetical protein
MPKSRKTVSVRVDAEDYKYLKLRALSNCRTIAGAIASVVKQCEKSDPISFEIRKIIHKNSSEQYCVRVNVQEYDYFCESASLAGALGLLDAYRNEHGYTDYRRFKLEKEIEVFDLRFEVDTGNGIMGLA